MIFIIATLKTTINHRDALVRATKLCIAETRKETGCIGYDFHQSVSDPNCFVFVERWQNKDVLQTHLKSDHLDAWRTAIGQLIVDKTVEIITPEKVEGL